MKSIFRILPTAALTSLLFGGVASHSWAQGCSSPSFSSLSTPVEQNRTIEVDTLGITFQIPDNYRTAIVDGVTHVLAPESYDYLQCRLQREPQDDDYPLSIAL